MPWSGEARKAMPKESLERAVITAAAYANSNSCAIIDDNYIPHKNGHILNRCRVSMSNQTFHLQDLSTLAIIFKCLSLSPENCEWIMWTFHAQHK